MPTRGKLREAGFAAIGAADVAKEAGKQALGKVRKGAEQRRKAAAGAVDDLARRGKRVSDRLEGRAARVSSEAKASARRTVGQAKAKATSVKSTAKKKATRAKA